MQPPIDPGSAIGWGGAWTRREGAGVGMIAVPEYLVDKPERLEPSDLATSCDLPSGRPCWPWVAVTTATGLLGCAPSEGDQLSSSPAATADSGYVAAPTGPVYYEQRGAGPSIIFLHGGNLDRRVWDPQFESLADSFHVVRYDIRPFGRSSPASQAYSDEGDLLTLMDSLGVRDATLVGLSLGARIAIDFALTHPMRVEHLVLVAPGLGGYEFAGQEERAARFGAAYELGGVEELVEEWLRDPYMVPAMEDADLAPKLRRIAKENGSAWLPTSRPHSPEELSPPAIDRLGEINARTLIVVGERDVQDIHVISRLLNEGIAGSTRVEIPGAGHIVNLEASEPFVRVLLSFLNDGSGG